MKKVINLSKLYVLVLLLILPIDVWAASVNSIRYNSSPTRVRIVLDFDGTIQYQEKKEANKIIIDLQAGVKKESKEPVKDPLIKEVVLSKVNKKNSQLIVSLQKDAQYKVFTLKNPQRLVIDIYRIQIFKNTINEAQGLKYTYWQDDMEGRPVQMYILELAPKSRYKLEPFSGAINKNGRGSLLKATKKLGAKAAVNASYFDTSGWIIGNLKWQNEWLGMEEHPRSAFVMTDGKPQIMTDLAYVGQVSLPTLGTTLKVKGINRERIAEDLVLYTRYFGEETRTNLFGCEVRIKKGVVQEKSTQGNMRIDNSSIVLSGHGSNAQVLKMLKVGDRVSIDETLGNKQADKADLVLGAGPLLVEDGKRNVRSAIENIAKDIASGRAPRTAIGVKKDGSIILLVVDGRNINSVGMTLNELADYMIKLGAVEALNLDGGGSSEMILNNIILNQPSGGKERPISIGLGLFPKRS